MSDQLKNPARSPRPSGTALKTALNRALAAFLAVTMSVPLTGLVHAQPLPPSSEGEVVLRDFHFADGTSMPALRLHYTTLGTMQRDAAGRVTNAAVLLHGTTSTGRGFLSPAINDVLFVPGAPLDASRYFLIFPDGIGAGGSSKPSDGLHGKFPHYGTIDQVEALVRMLGEGLHIDHLALVLGTSAGGMQTWLLGERHPDMMDGLVAIATPPVPVTGRNLLWRQMIIDAIRSDPDWHDGSYKTEPVLWRHILPLIAIMTGNALRLEAEASHRDAGLAFSAQILEAGRALHPDDVLAIFESSRDFDPGPGLSLIKAPLLAINFGDDLVNPPELNAMAGVMSRVPHGTAIFMPASRLTYGHATELHPEVWAKNLGFFLRTLTLPGASQQR